MAAQVEQLRDRVLEMFESGSRYKAEKIVTVAVYLVLVVGTVFWAFSGEDRTNELGASYGYETVGPLDAKIFFLENESGDDWTNVRVVLNQAYLYKIDEIEAGDRAALRPADFDYYYYVPRPWGRNDWETLARKKKPGPKAPANIEPKKLEIRADQGRLDIDLTKSPKGKSSG